MRGGTALPPLEQQRRAHEQQRPSRLSNTTPSRAGIETSLSRAKVHRRAATDTAAADPRLPLKRPPGSEATVRRSHFGRPLVTNRDAPAVDNRHCSRLKQFPRETRSSCPKSAAGNAAALRKNFRALISLTPLDVSIELIAISRASFQPR